MTIKIIETLDLGHENHITSYLGRQDDFIATGIVPPDFFNFRASMRECSRGWYGKRISTTHSFPDGVEKICVRRGAGGHWRADITHEIDKPPYVPPGQVWPRPKKYEESKTRTILFHPNDNIYSGEKIGTGISLRVTDVIPRLAVHFCGTKERLIAAGLAVAMMFPEGKTPSGKIRREKQSSAKTENSWRVYTGEREGEWDVYFYDIPMDPDDLAVRVKLEQAEANRLSRNTGRRPQREDDEW